MLYNSGLTEPVLEIYINLASDVVEKSTRRQSYWKTFCTNLAPLRLCKIIRYDVLWDTESSTWILHYLHYKRNTNVKIYETSITNVPMKYKI